MSRAVTAPLAAFAFLLAVSCCCCCPSWEPGEGWEWPETPTRRATSIASQTPSPSAEHAGPDLLQESSAETALLLETAEIPIRDLHELAARLGGGDPLIPRTTNPDGSPDYPEGTRRLFHCTDLDTDLPFDIYAVLEYKTDHVYMWVDEGVRFDPQAVASAGDTFETQIYPTNRAFFGSEWNPGVDNDPHLGILHASGLGSTILGYFSAADEYVAGVREDSNEMEMFYINTDNMRIGSDDYYATLAHEFQHMIRWYQDRNEDTWLDEGLADLASALNGFDTVGHSAMFAAFPDNQLNHFNYDSADVISSYGSAYLFAAYFLDRFGEEATRSLAASEANGLEAVDAALLGMTPQLSHEDVFADWVLANLLDDPTIDGGAYGYRDSDPPPFSVEAEHDERDLPLSESTEVHQYAVDYIDLEGDEPLLFRFQGGTMVGLADTFAHSGLYSWYSNRADDSDATLTRSFDLSGVSQATLEYWTWYDIEEDWDYAYLEASTDGGESWEIVTTPSCTTANPNLSSYGCAYTGASGGFFPPQWVKQEVDLGPYTGHEVVLRFEYITDDAVNQPGIMIDDIAIPQIDYASDFEQDGGGWETAGFIRSTITVPQEWILQLVLFGAETTVQRLELGEDQFGEWLIPLEGKGSRAVIAVSATAPLTSELARYTYEVELQQ
jgi:immune inhibitor A